MVVEVVELSEVLFVEVLDANGLKSECNLSKSTRSSVLVDGIGVGLGLGVGFGFGISVEMPRIHLPQLENW